MQPHPPAHTTATAASNSAPTLATTQPELTALSATPLPTLTTVTVDSDSSMNTAPSTPLSTGPQASSATSTSLQAASANNHPLTTILQPIIKATTTAIKR